MAAASMDNPTKDEIKQLTQEIAPLTTAEAAAESRWLSNKDPDQEHKLKEFYEAAKENRKDRVQQRHILQCALASAGVAIPAVPTLDAYRNCIAKLPAPSIFGERWTAYQYADSTKAGQASFKSIGPLLNVYRPSTARGLPAAFAHEAFGGFLDAKHSAPVTSDAAKAVFRLIEILSHSYLSTNTDACKAAVAKSLRPDFKGEARGQEADLMQEVRNALLLYLRAAMPEDTAFSTLEPSASSYLSSDATDGTGKLRNPEGKVSRIYILILEGKIDWGLGGGSNPVMQLCGFYALYLKGLWTSSAVAETFLPAVGVEIYGHGIRIHAIFFTDRICCEPLTEWVHFVDLRDGQPGYMLYLIRIVHAFGELCSKLTLAMLPYTDSGPDYGLPRELQLTDGIPYMLRDPRFGIERMNPKKHVFLLTPINPDSGVATFVAKVVATPYPEQLHQELSNAGLAPELREPVQKYPGGVSVISMAYLDPADGWVSLRSYSGDWEQLEQLAKASVAALHECLDSSAVHGDLSADNVFVRMAKPEPGASGCTAFPEAMQFIDLAWGGKQNEAQYPPFVNGNSLRSIKEADGQLILQAHDRKQLSMNIEWFRAAAKHRCQRKLALPQGIRKAA